MGRPSLQESECLVREDFLNLSIYDEFFASIAEEKIAEIAAQVNKNIMELYTALGSMAPLSEDKEELAYRIGIDPHG